MELANEQLLAMVKAVPDPLFILTESGKYVGVFGGLDSSYYHDGSALVGRRIQDVLPRQKADWILAKIAQSLEEQRLCTVEYGLSGKDVEGLDPTLGPEGEIWFEGRIQPLPFAVEGERAVVWTARNITKRYRLEAALRRITERDELTDVFNRRKLMEVLEERFREFRRHRNPASLIMLDLDHFKQINDRHGHMVGDAALCAIATACSRQLRDLDILARFGGEEFSILLPNTPLEDAAEVAERLREAVAATRVLHGAGEIDVTASFGVSTFVASDTRADAVLTRSDDALYAAKHAGRNRVMLLPTEGEVPMAWRRSG